MFDNLVGLRKSDLTHYLGSLGAAKEADVDKALRLAFRFGMTNGAGICRTQKRGTMFGQLPATRDFRAPRRKRARPPWCN
jgi:hypothetical protein